MSQLDGRDHFECSPLHLSGPLEFIGSAHIQPARHDDWEYSPSLSCIPPTQAVGAYPQIVNINERHNSL